MISPSVQIQTSPPPSTIRTLEDLISSILCHLPLDSIPSRMEIIEDTMTRTLVFKVPVKAVKRFKRVVQEFVPINVEVFVEPLRKPMKKGVVDVVRIPFYGTKYTFDVESSTGHELEQLAHLYGMNNFVNLYENKC